MAKTQTRKTRSPSVRAKPASTKPDPPIGAIDHAKGCPAEREEAYRAETPEGDKVIVSRCLDCPGHVVEPEV